METKVEKICETCGKTYYAPKRFSERSKYCSCKCSAQSLKTEKVKKVCEICGKTFYVLPHRTDTAKYCSVECKAHSQHADYTGRRFGMLTAIKPTQERSGNGSVIWEFKCDCGNTCHKTCEHLNGTSSCGCATRELKKINGAEIGAENLLKGCVCDTNVNLIQPGKIKSSNTSGYTGVYWHGQRSFWCARITFQKKTYYLGCYKDKEEAIKARKRAEEMLFEPFLKWYENEFKKKNKEAGVN